MTHKNSEQRRGQKYKNRLTYLNVWSRPQAKQDKTAAAGLVESFAAVDKNLFDRLLGSTFDSFGQGGKQVR